MIVFKGHVGGSLITIQGEESQLQPALIKCDPRRVVQVLAHGVRQEFPFVGVLGHHGQESIHITRKVFGVLSEIQASLCQVLLHIAQLAADFMALLLVDPRQVGVKIAGQGDIRCGLQGNPVVGPIPLGCFLFQGGQGGRAFEDVIKVKQFPVRQVFL